MQGPWLYKKYLRLPLPPLPPRRERINDRLLDEGFFPSLHTSGSALTRVVTTRKIAAMGLKKRSGARWRREVLCSTLH